MRVIVAGRLRFSPETDCAALIRGGADAIAASRAEQGCVAYDWALDPSDPGVVQVFEEWVSEAALGAHFRDPSYLAMRRHLEAQLLTGFDVKIYGVSGVEPVYTDEGRPRDAIFGVRIDG